LDRRRFLKCAGATAAFVGASAFGLDYLSKQNHSAASPIASTTNTSGELTTSSSLNSSSTSSTEAIQLTSLQGRLFFDHNGNGKQDGEEPAVPKARVILMHRTRGFVTETVTDSSGDYRLEDIRTGLYTLHVEAEKNFQYMCRSSEEFRRVTEGYELSLEYGADVPGMDIGLMEGFLTLPLSSKTKYSVGRYYDWDPDPKKSLWWSGMVGSDPYNHEGIDYDTGEGEDVLAPAPGYLYPIERGPEGQLPLGLYHPDAGLATVYNHLSKVVEKAAVKGFVTRGEKIAETGSTGASYPHLHFGTATRIDDHDAFFDPYRPLFALDAKNNGYWARVQEKDYWQTAPGGVNPNLENFWTRDNDPHYALA